MNCLQARDEVFAQRQIRVAVDGRIIKIEFNFPANEQLGAAGTHQVYKTAKSILVPCPINKKYRSAERETWHRAMQPRCYNAFGMRVNAQQSTSYGTASLEQYATLVPVAQIRPNWGLCALS